MGIRAHRLSSRQGPLESGAQGWMAAAPAVAVLAVDTEFYEHIPDVLLFRPKARDVFAADAELATHTGRFSATLHAGYLIMAVRAVGLAAGPMAGFDAEALDADFFPGGRWKSILVVNIGHPRREPVVRTAAAATARQRHRLGLTSPPAPAIPAHPLIVSTMGSRTGSHP